MKATQAGYKAYDDGVKALAKGDTGTATTLAKQAIAIEPREARFQELLGDIALKKNSPQEALGHYERAIKMQPDYFRPHVQSGVALKMLGRNAEAETHLNHSNALLPTAPGFYSLGQIAEEKGDMENALKNYQIAADSNTDVGQSAMASLMRLDLPRNPAKYLESGALSDNSGNLYAVVQNPTSTAVANVQIRVVRYDPATNRAVSQSQPVLVASLLKPNQRAQVNVGVRVANQAELNLYRVNIESAEVAK